MSKVLSLYWNMYINGEALSLSRKKCIESIDFEELCDGSDTATIKVCDPDFLYIEDNIFVEEAIISIKAGWHGDTHRVSFDGYISAIDIDFPDSGYPVMSVMCLDNSHLMNRKKKTRSWDNVTRADVVKKIATEYGLKCVVESGYNFKTESSISQSGSTDIEFCESLAKEERDPFMCKLIGDTLYYVKKGILASPSATFTYRKKPFDLISFKPQINKETKQEETTASDINTNDKTTETSKADKDTPHDTQGEPVKTTSGYEYDTTTGTWVKAVK